MLYISVLERTLNYDPNDIHWVFSNKAMTTTAGSYAKPRIGIQLNLISCFSSLGVRRWPVSQAWLVMAVIFCVGVLMRRWVMEVDGSLTSRPRQPVDSTIHHKLATHTGEPSSNPHHLARLCKLH